MYMVLNGLSCKYFHLIVITAIILISLTNKTTPDHKQLVDICIAPQKKQKKAGIACVDNNILKIKAQIKITYSFLVNE